MGISMNATQIGEQLHQWEHDIHDLGNLVQSQSVPVEEQEILLDRISDIQDRITEMFCHIKDMSPKYQDTWEDQLADIESRIEVIRRRI